MRPHDFEIFLENCGGVGEVFAGFEKRANGKFGSPESIGHAGCEAGLAGEDLHEEEVGDAAGHADDELAESVGSFLAKVGGKETEVGQDAVGFFSGDFITR